MSSKMDVDQTQRILTALMILSFLIFGLLSGVILIFDAPLGNASAALPFAFLFISGMSLITTGQIRERPQRVNKYLREWLVIIIFVVALSALTFTLA